MKDVVKKYSTKHIFISLMNYFRKTYFYHLLTGAKDGFIFDKVLIILLTRVWNEVSPVIHTHMKYSSLKYFEKKYFIHFITRTEKGSMCDTIVSSSF